LPDGRVGLSFDGRWRVQLRPLTDGRFLMSAMLLDVSNLTRSQLEDLLLSLATYSVGVMQDHACGLALDEASGRLMLQEQVPAETSLAQLEAALGDFVNLLAFWNGSARMEAVRREVAPIR
jgi:hypothetical protein